ncbi:hypothetical protein NM688_g4912 [Phlebia brevispora]|uniref:Uncharacterized protein n=1 Tax=Phlebia brevispora TaxID=194682 RepID=A0ACC1T1J2_9APHY|nr:hypothetical protein NM688_g4912 [Phlebia brevispora]
MSEHPSSSSQNSAELVGFHDDFTRLWEGKFTFRGVQATRNPVDTISDELGRLLVAWNEDGGKSTPEKLILLLEESLPSQNLRATALTGLDSWRVAFFASSAAMYGFELGLANVVVYKRGRSNDSRGKYLRRERISPITMSDEEEVEDSGYTDPSESNLRFSPDTPGSHSDEDEDDENKEDPLEEMRVEAFAEMDGSIIRHTPQVRTAGYRAYMHNHNFHIDDIQEAAEVRSIEEDREGSQMEMEIGEDIAVKAEDADDEIAIKAEDETTMMEEGIMVKAEGSNETKTPSNSNMGAIADQDNDSLVIDERTETIPANMREAIMASRRYNKQKYDGLGYTDRGDTYVAGHLHRWWFRTALVIWPRYAARLVHDQASIETVCQELSARASASRRPDTNDRKLAYLLSSRYGDSDSAPTILFRVAEAALHWADLDLWNYAVQHCAAKGGLLSSNAVQSAAACFGFPAVRPCVEMMLIKDGSNAHVYNFLQELKSSIKDPSWTRAQASTSDILAWIEGQLTTFTLSLRKPAKDDFGVLLELAKLHDSDYWVEMILPQIVPVAEYDVLKTLAGRMYNEGSSAVGHEASHKLAEKLLEACVPLLDITIPLGKWKFPSPPPDVRCLDVMKEYITTCVDCRCTHVASKLLLRLAEGEEDELSWAAEERARWITLPLLVFVEEHVPEDDMRSEPFLSSLKNLADTAVQKYMKDPRASCIDVRKEDIQNLFRTALLPGGADILAARILPGLGRIQTSEAIARTVVDIFCGMLPTLNSLTSYEGPSIRGAFAHAVKKYAQRVSIESREHTAEALEYFIRMNAPAAFWVLIKRVLSPEKLKYYRTYPIPEPVGDGNKWYSSRPAIALYERIQVASGRPELKMLTLVGALREILDKHDKWDTYKPAFGMILHAWVRDVLGVVPPDASARLAAIKEWKSDCRCELCTKLQTFFLDHLDIGTKLTGFTLAQLKHALEELDKYATEEAAEWRLKRGRHPEITVTKSKLIQDHMLWQFNCNAVARMLDDLSPDSAEQAHILGDEYMDIKEWMQGLTLEEAKRRGYVPPIEPLPPPSPPPPIEEPEHEGRWLRSSKRRRIEHGAKT